MNQRFYLTFAFVFLFVGLFAQDRTKVRDYVQFSGKVVQLETKKPIPGVRITNLTRGTLSFTNNEGIFTIVVAPEDRIQLSHLGMGHQYFNIPKTENTKLYREFALNIEPEKIKEVLINGLPPIDELAERLMALKVYDDPARQLALENPDMFNILDTIIVHEPSLLSFKNGKVESSPISWFYEKVYKKIKEKLPKPERKGVLPKFKEKEPDISN